MTQANSSSSGRPTAAVILAAGRSTRMKTELPKVLHEVCGRPMLAYVLDACRQAGISRLIIVVGFGREAVEKTFANEPDVTFVHQAEQKGSGHAVMVCADSLKGFTGDCVVIAGDMPLIQADTLSTLIGGHRATGAAASLATTTLDDPTGYGRIVRNARGEFEKIVEHRDCTPEQLAIREVNPSYYCFDAATLLDVLPKIKPNNAKGEYYITDTLELIRAAGKPVRASVNVPAADATGINSRVDLAAVSAMMQQRIATRWMESGVTIVSPSNTWIDHRATIGPETIIRPFTTIEGHARIGAGCEIGPYAYVRDGAVVADGAIIGPGILTAIDTAGKGMTAAASASGSGRKQVVVRRPPAQSGIA